MARKKKITRKDKEELFKKSKCWKCNSGLKRNNKVWICEGCGIQIMPSKI